LKNQAFYLKKEVATPEKKTKHKADSDSLLYKLEKELLEKMMKKKHKRILYLICCHCKRESYMDMQKKVWTIKKKRGVFWFTSLLFVKCLS